MHALACGLSREHEVELVDGGRPVPRAPDPPALRLLSLPRLARAGGRLVALDGGAPVAAMLAERADILARAIAARPPDAVLIDHFPFSKWELAAEIAAAIAAARRGNPAARIFCSLRDVAPRTRHEPADAAAYAARVRDELRAGFDGVLVHADPAFTRLEEHFAPAAALPVRVAYTGFVTPPPPPLAAPPSPPAAVLSCGGGAGALPFLLAASAAFARLAADGTTAAMPLLVFAGGFATPADLARLAAVEREPIRLRGFGPEFAAALAGSPLSISRAGYNTCAALLRARTRAVLVPDPAMSDQTYRARRFAQLGLAQVVEGDPPAVDALAAAMRAALAAPPPRHAFDLDGVAHTETAIAAWR
ncbi:hypothetical protein KF840_11305 [bacterium]|nr:hypothetical protein [bacterium]